MTNQNVPRLTRISFNGKPVDTLSSARELTRKLMSRIDRKSGTYEEWLEVYSLINYLDHVEGLDEYPD